MIVVNGGSSSGKSTLVRALQDLLVEPWLAASIDDLVDALPAALRASAEGFDVAPGGHVHVGTELARLEAAWRTGIAATARAGAPVVLDDVFLGGAASQRRWRESLTGLPVAWVGVRCAPHEAARREGLRGDREAGMAARQADDVHRGVDYDVEVDTTRTGADACARAVAAALGLDVRA